MKEFYCHGCGRYVSVELKHPDSRTHPSCVSCIARAQARAKAKPKTDYTRSQYRKPSNLKYWGSL